MPAIRQTERFHARSHRLILAAARQVHDLNTLRQRVRRARHRLIDVQSPQGSARHEQRRSISVHAQALSGLTARLHGPLRGRSATRQVSNS